MLSNFLKIAFRKLAKHRNYTLLNVLGLSLSVGCSLLIFILIRHHSSVDTYHTKASRIVRIVMDVKTETLMPFSGVPAPMAQTLREECSFVEKTAMRSGEEEVLISVLNAGGNKDKYKEEREFAWIEPEYLDILDLPLVEGDARAIAEPRTVLIAQHLAQKYFGEAGAIGKTLRLDNEIDLRVVGVLRDLPENTDYPQEILASWATLKADPKSAKGTESWGGARGDNYCFALLQTGHTLAEMEAFLPAFNQKHPHPELKGLFTYKAKALAGLHFDSDYGRGVDKKFLWALGCIGLFLLITACVNFVNMATAQALTRVREVGVRKSLGSTNGQLFWQFMAETGLIVGASLLAGLALAWVALPYLNAWLDTRLQPDAPMLAALAVFSLLLGAVLTFLAGFYPGLMQARFNPVLSMKGATEVPRGAGGFPLRRVLVTTQFAISQILIIGATVVTAQMRYAQEADWGFRPGAVLTLPIPKANNMNSLQQQLSQLPGVQSVSLCYQPPASGSSNQTGVQYDSRPEPEAWLVNNKPADAQYVETFGLQLVAGRNLQASDTLREFLVNETFVKKLNLASPEEVLNKTIVLEGKKIPIVGVLRDFHNWELAQPISAITIGSGNNQYATCAVQLQPGNPAAVLPQVRAVWETLYPDHFYEQRFMDEQLGEFLETEIMLARLVRTGAGIAILIGCLGLYGLAAFMVSRKRKEVGIRKTLGATVPGILWLFGKEYTRLLLLAFVLAAPLAWWAMDAWLQEYAYRVSLGAGIFLVSLGATALVAVATVGFQSVRAALANPVESLRNE
ncbi:MAG: ABC transporter permease [Saprospiraceae bacterium]|nr:ABC transporter permease [Saprospiraceae bacterium]